MVTPALSVYGDDLLEDGSGGEDSGQPDLEMEQQLLEQRLRLQQRESEEDGRWLAEEETNLVSSFSEYKQCCERFCGKWYSGRLKSLDIASHCGGPGLSSDHVGFVVDEAALGRFSPSTSVSPAIYSTDCSTLVIHHLGLVH
jgi:hypothetical protein